MDYCHWLCGYCSRSVGTWKACHQNCWKGYCTDHSSQVRLNFLFIQGCLANSDDGNRQKVVRISPIVRISPTMPEKSFALINSFLPKRSNYFFYKRPNMAFKCSLALFSHIKTQFMWSKYPKKVENMTEKNSSFFPKSRPNQPDRPNQHRPNQLNTPVSKKGLPASLRLKKIADF